ncbi:MAG: hypothetical protein V8R01_01835 [Bacilli bacterium]
MRIIKCDICNKEISFEELTRQHLNGNQIDVCINCIDNFKSTEFEFMRDLSKLENEYEAKKRNLYKNVVQKLGLK